MSYAAWTGAATFHYWFKKWARIWKQDQEDFVIPPLPSGVVTLGPTGVTIVEETKKWGIVAVLAVLLLLSSSD
ncbi:hypothetical protein ES703_54433 [subsurface metagenome]